MLLKIPSGNVGHAYIAAGFVGVATVSGFEGLGVQVNVRLGGEIQYPHQSACMIVVAVAQDNRIHFSKIDAQGLCIGLEKAALAGVEEDSAVVSLNPYRPTVLWQQCVGVAGVVDQDGYGYGFGHGMEPPLAEAVSMLDFWHYACGEIFAGMTLAVRIG